MTVPDFRLAVIADAHFHDVGGDYGQGNGPAYRPASDVVKSTRVFNETGAALRHALSDIAARGIGHVVLLGDWTDDGQRPAREGLQCLLDEARGEGLRFWAVPGNHDVFADTGRHRTRRIVGASGGIDLVTSDPGRTDPAAARVWVTPRMRCPAQPEGLLTGLGFFRDARDLHWETPFGASDAPEDRRYRVCSADGTVERVLMDASYLVEPVPGVWLMMIDANVWVPHGANRPPDDPGDYADSTLAGWAAVLGHKAFLLGWMRDVVARAARQGKRLMTFSHYPVLDPFAGSRATEMALLGLTPLARRLPGPAVAQAIAETGIGLHFSGHLHLDATTRATPGGRALVNVAVPSLAAFPAAFKIVTAGALVRVETVDLAAMPMPPTIRYPGRLAGHADYGSFLAEHAGHLVARRHLRREWPEGLAAAVPVLTLADMMGDEKGAGVAALAVLEDFYRVRMGGGHGTALIPADRLVLFRRAINDAVAGRMHGRWKPLFVMLGDYLARLPTRDITINCATGAVRGV